MASLRDCGDRLRWRHCDAFYARGLCWSCCLNGLGFTAGCGLQVTCTSGPTTASPDEDLCLVSGTLTQPASIDYIFHPSKDLAWLYACGALVFVHVTTASSISQLPDPMRIWDWDHGPAHSVHWHNLQSCTDNCWKHFSAGELELLCANGNPQSYGSTAAAPLCSLVWSVWPRPCSVLRPEDSESTVAGTI